MLSFIKAMGSGETNRNDRASHGRQRPAPRLAIAVAIVVLLKISGGVLDHLPRLFLGDSACYIHTALTGWIPPDRSFTYGYIVRWTGVAFHSLGALVGVQILFSLLAVMLVLTAARSIVGGRASLVWLAIPLAIAPIQTMYERFVMTETASGLLLAALLFCAAGYLRRSRLLWLALLAVIAFLGVSLRVSVVPNLVATAVLLPLLGVPVTSTHPQANRAAGRLFRMGGHIVFSVVLTGLLLVGYQHCYSKVSGAPPAFHSRQGYFLLATAAPLVRPEYFFDKEVRSAVWAPGGVDATNPDLRNAQMFLPEGILRRMERAIGDSIRVDAEARRIATTAIMRQPLRFTALGWHNVKHYLDWNRLDKLVHVDLGNREMPGEFAETLKEHFGFAPQPAQKQPSVVSTYFGCALIWYQILVFGSWVLVLLAAIGTWRSFAAPLSRFLVLTSVNLLVAIGVTVFLAPAPSVRYLHPVELMFILVAWLVVVQRNQRWRLYQTIG